MKYEEIKKIRERAQRAVGYNITHPNEPILRAAVKIGIAPVTLEGFLSGKRATAARIIQKILNWLEIEEAE